MFNFLLAIIYLAFIGLGLPDSLLGAAWPAMHRDIDAPLSFAGFISIIIAAGTIFSSLMSDRLTKRLGTGWVTALSVGLTAVALFGFSFSSSLIALCLWAIPYGLGAGSVDASINNYVAVHYKSHHMNWLHCMWGVGATAGPYVMGLALSQGNGWSSGYQYVAIAQVILTGLLFLSLPLWKKNSNPEGSNEENSSSTNTTAVLSLRQIFAIPGTKALSICFFCYCGIEQTAILWASSYFSTAQGLSPEIAASYAGMFFIGITAGRAVSGFLSMKFTDTQMIRYGELCIALGALMMIFAWNSGLSLAGLLLIGLGCAPVYPSIIHAIPALFGSDKSQAIIGAQMASAYIGTLAIPPLFGVLAELTDISLLPYYLVFILILMLVAFERLSAREKTPFEKPTKR